MNIPLLSKSSVGRRYLQHDAEGWEQPTIDDFLDFRNHLKTMIENDKQYPNDWWQAEMESTDEILKHLNQQQ